jgi:hypothetical protein
MRKDSVMSPHTSFIVPTEGYPVFLFPYLWYGQPITETIGKVTYLVSDYE